MLSTCLTLLETATLFSKVAVQFCTPTSNVEEFQLLHSPTSEWHDILTVLNKEC